jgi:hypothetical protein
MKDGFAPHFQNVAGNPKRAEDAENPKQKKKERPSGNSFPIGLIDVHGRRVVSAHPITSRGAQRESKTQYDGGDSPLVSRHLLIESGQQPFQEPPNV